MKVLMIHQSSDFYGSDKVCLAVVRAFTLRNHSVVVLLPSKGPLVKHLVDAGADVVLGDVGKINSRSASFRGLLFFIFSLVRSQKEIYEIYQKFEPDFIYSNTLAVLGGLFFALRKKIHHIHHIHEIINQDKTYKYFFRQLIKFSNLCIFNSKATKESLVFSPKQEQYVKILLNPIIFGEYDCHNRVSNRTLTRELIRVGVVGRINGWKGQSLFLNAVEQLHPSLRARCEFYLAGDCLPADQDISTNLGRRCCSMRNLGISIQMLGRVDKMHDLYSNLDILVVPSLKPEPFGLVAVEGMYYGLAVLAAEHGGLTEIISHGVDGLFFRPGSITSLAKSLERLINDPEYAREIGTNAKATASARFSEDEFGRSLIEAVELSLKG